MAAQFETAINSMRDQLAALAGLRDQVNGLREMFAGAQGQFGAMSDRIAAAEGRVLSQEALTAGQGGLKYQIEYQTNRLNTLEAELQAHDSRLISLEGGGSGTQSRSRAREPLFEKRNFRDLPTYSGRSQDYQLWRTRFLLFLRGADSNSEKILR